MTPVTRDYSSVTEVAGEMVRRDALEKMVARYSFAASRSVGRDVLEVACGSGQGLGLIHRSASRVVAGDYTFGLIREAAVRYGGRVAFSCFDGQALPYREDTFDLVLCYEAIYYLPDAPRFFAEAARVLRPGGELIIVTVNPSWPGFNPSPHSTRYYRGPELHELLERHGFAAEVHGAFVERGAGPAKRVVELIRRIAVSMHLVPRTMRAKRLLKRVFYGRLIKLPPELAAAGPLPDLERIEGDAPAATVLYAIGRRPSSERGGPSL